MADEFNSFLIGQIRHEKRHDYAVVLFYPTYEYPSNPITWMLHGIFFAWPVAPYFPTDLFRVAQSPAFSLTHKVTFPGPQASSSISGFSGFNSWQKKSRGPCVLAHIPVFVEIMLSHLLNNETASFDLSMHNTQTMKNRCYSSIVSPLWLSFSHSGGIWG